MAMSRSESQIPDDCQFCHSWRKPDYTTMPKLTYPQWISGILQSPCIRCQYLLQAIRKLEPKFLELGSSVTADMKFWIFQNGEFFIDTTPRIGVIRIQLFSTALLQQLPDVHLAREISPVPGDQHMWTFLRECLNTCVHQHSICKTAQNRHWWPRRLLRLIQTEACAPFLRLVDTATSPPTSPYLTLSHCWGGERPLCTTSNNLERHQRRIDLHELPKAFQNCVTVAKELGVDYIWIDSLCIIQGNNSDWAQHAQAMGEIYQNAIFTVAAVASRNSTIAFLGPDAPSQRHRFRSVPLLKDESTSSCSGIRARRHDASLHSGFILGPLEYRGWAWQERRLSVRTINFTDDEVHWCCKSVNACECSAKGTPIYSQKRDDYPMALADEWRAVISEYSDRSLTYPTDRLPALSGYASRFKARSQSRYIAGLWSSDFPACLAWCRRDLCDCDCFPGPELHPRLDNALPSWSWASIHRQVFWPDDGPSSEAVLDTRSSSPESRVEVVSINCLPSTDNLYGEVQEDAYIELIGKVVEAEMETNIYGCGLVRRQGCRPQLVQPDCRLTMTEDVQRRNRFFPWVKKPTLSSSQHTLRRATMHDRLHTKKADRIKGIVTCLLLYTIQKDDRRYARVLILARTPVQDNLYQRVGIGGEWYREGWKRWAGWEPLEKWENWENWFADAETRKLRIV